MAHSYDSAAEPILPYGRVRGQHNTRRTAKNVLAIPPTHSFDRT